MADYTILIADYDPITTDLATTVFEAAGFDVQIAKDGLTAVEGFKKYRPLLTLIEFMMPKKAGLEVCRDLRNSVEGRDADLVVMSSPFRGRAFRADAVRIYGATETVEKPLDKEKLEELLTRLVRPRAAELTNATPQADPAPAAITARPPVRTAPAPSPPVETSQADATAQTLRDVVSSVLGPEQLGEPDASSGAPRKPAAVTAADALFRPSIAEERAGEAEIEDHIDSLFDF